MAAIPKIRMTTVPLFMVILLVFIITNLKPEKPQGTNRIGSFCCDRDLYPATKRLSKAQTQYNIRDGCTKRNANAATK
jgi:hypothetical protein